jgi:methionyl-tRNA formyltransferase
MSSAIDSKRYVFAGNRFFVLEEMIRLGLNVVEIYVVSNSFLQKELEDRRINYQVISTKRDFVIKLKGIKFDIFISNGLPLILPISELIRGTEKKFINIHPSPLPDLRGVDPVPGAILYGRNSGATCHYMDDGIDSGSIISQVVIPIVPEFDAKTLYQLSFLAEKDVFLKAYECSFLPVRTQVSSEKDIYYTFKEDDLQIDFRKPISEVIRKIRAFNTPSKGAYFVVNGYKVKVYDVSVLKSSWAFQKFLKCNENEVVLKSGDAIVIKKSQSFLLLKNLIGDFLDKIEVGLVLK